MDFYTVLGVSPVASAAEIERAYRRLARLYHPGVNPGDRVSQEMYQQIQQAHAVLVDANRRREYDRGAAGGPDRDGPAVAFAGFDFSIAAEGPLAATFSELFSDVFQEAAREATTPTRGADIELIVGVSFTDAMRGADVPLSVTRQERCQTCHGQGRVARVAATCPVCAGAGSRKWARGHLVFTKICEACEGAGRLVSEACRPCAGVGTTARTEVVTLSLPAGLESGARMAVPGRGHAGARGGPAGDLYAVIDVAEHRVFRRVGRDIHLTVPVAVHEAALGARIEVPGLDGPVRLRVPPGTTSGQQLRVRGAGVGSGAAATGDEAGDLIVDIQIALPGDLDEASKDLLREFGRRNGTDPRQQLFLRG